jgi:hypothetical protein
VPPGDWTDEDEIPTDEDNIVFDGEDSLYSAQNRDKKELKPLELNDSSDEESDTVPIVDSRGRIRRWPKSDEGLHVALAVWNQRTEEGTLPFQASKARLITLSRALVAEVGSDKATAALVDTLDFTPGCINFSLGHTNGKKTSADVIAEWRKERDNGTKSSGRSDRWNGRNLGKG